MPESSDALLIAAVGVGAFIDAATQIFLSRAMRLKLFPSIAAAFLAGSLATLGIASLGLFQSAAAILDRVALMVVVLTSYASFGFCLFALINLGETSLRLRMLRQILTSDGALSVEDVLAGYDDDVLVSARFDRMVENRHVSFIDDRFHARPSFLFATARLLFLIRRLLYGKKPVVAAK